MESKAVSRVGPFRSWEFFNLFSEEVRRTSFLSIFLSMVFALTLLAFSLGVVAFERMGHYREKAEGLRTLVQGSAGKRLETVFDGHLSGSRILLAVKGGDTEYIRDLYRALERTEHLTGLRITNEGREVFREGIYGVSHSGMSGRLSPGGGLNIGETFRLRDDAGREYPDMAVSIWLDMSRFFPFVERFAGNASVYSDTPQAGAVPVVSGIWMVLPDYFQILVSLREDRGLVLAFLGQVIGVFLMSYLGFMFFSQREGMSQRVISLAGILEEKDPYTMGHSDRVARIAQKIGREMGVRGRGLKTLCLAARTHDLGKIFVPSEILGKRGSLTHREWLHIWRHSVDSERLFMKLFPDRRVARIVRSHHERWDGKGYPDGLVRENIPLGSRIIAVADTFDTMTTKRPYRDALPVEKALRVIEENAGSQFDPEVARKGGRVLRDLFADRILAEEGRGFEVQESGVPESPLVSKEEEREIPKDSAAAKRESSGPLVENPARTVSGEAEAGKETVGPEAEKVHPADGAAVGDVKREPHEDGVAEIGNFPKVPA